VTLVTNDGTASGRPFNLTRREVIAAASAVGIAAALGLPEAAVAKTADATKRRAAEVDDFVASAASVPAHGSDLGAIEHVVFLMMENRSYDHYFGAYHKGRGFDDHPKHDLGVFAQAYPGGTGLSPAKKLLPFLLDYLPPDDCTHDLTHNWGPQHEAWNRGKMNRWVKTHTEKQYEGDPNGALSMGYYTRKQLPFHWSLADHFTLCDAYHCSILGPTHPNRVMSLSGTIDPAGKHGGPITDTNPDPRVLWSCDWTTAPELLEDKGIPWKVYHPSNVGVSGRYAPLVQFPTWHDSFYDPDNPSVMALSDHVLPYFKNFKNPSSPLHKKAFHPTFPNDFVKDCESGNLPKVSWVIPPLGFDEHPSGSPERGQWFVQEVLRQIMKHRKLWSKTVVFLMYDENDGWFDHVKPPTPPRGTPGEWLTAADISHATNGIRGPAGLGIRVPMTVISPFSRGGHVNSELFDHTSQLQFLSARFGIEVPGVSNWRLHKVGDLTSTLHMGHHDNSMPALPRMPLPAESTTGNCGSQDTEFGGASPTIPTKQRMPTQKGTTIPAGRFFVESRTKTDRVPLRSGAPRPTTKSAANALAHGQEVPKVSRKHNR
jgi:phospholipase C